MNKHFFTLFVSFSALFFITATAQEADSSEIKFFPPDVSQYIVDHRNYSPPLGSVVRIEEIVVTSTRSQLTLRETPVITRVIYPADIVRSGVSSVSALLERELAGVEFHQAGYGATMSFQGLDARYVLILVDGERIAGETYGNVDLSRIQMNNIARIEIVRGASSVLYGSNAMGAVVNIITRMPYERVEVSGSLRFGTRFQNNSGEMLQSGASDKDLDYYRGRLDLPNTKSDVSVGLNLGKFRSLTGLSYHTTDAYKVLWRENEIRTYETLTIQSVGGAPVAPVISNGEVVSVAPDTRGLGVSGARDYSLSQRFDYRISSKFNFSAAGNYFNKDQYGFRTSIMDDNPMSATSTTAWKYETFEGYNIKAMMEHDPTSDHKVTLSYVRDEYIRDEQTLGGALKHKQRHSYNNPRLLWNYRISYDNRLTTGVEMLNENLQFDINPLGFDSKKSLNSGSVYVQDELFMHSKLSFVVGARGDYNDRFGWGFTPKVSAKYNVNDFILRANYSRGYRTPSLKELYMELSVPGSTAMIIKGNEKLKSESNNYYSLSGEYKHRTFSVSVTGFVSDFKNKIDVYSTMIGNVNTMLYDNIAKSTLAGVELMARYQIVRGLAIKANYNYVKTVSDDAPKGSTKYIFPSEHTATGVVTYDFNIRNKQFIVVTANVRYVGPKDYQDFMTYIKPTGAGKFDIYSGNYSAHHKGYTTLGAAVSARWSEKIITTVGVENMFNYLAPVVNFNSAMMPGRNGFVQVNFNF